MNSLYHKVAVASVCTALSFTLGANKEAKAATFNLTAPAFLVAGSDVNGGIYFPDSNSSGAYISNYQDYNNNSGTRAFYEFYIGNLSLAPNTNIKSAFFNLPLSNISASYKYFFVEILGYVGNGKPDLSDFKVGGTIDLIDFKNLKPIPVYPYPLQIDVTYFVKELVKNGDDFAGFGLRGATFTYSNGSASLGNSGGGLTIETEPVPEPTTIFGSAIALGVGGWLKRNKLSR